MCRTQRRRSDSQKDKHNFSKRNKNNRKYVVLLVEGQFPFLIV